MIANGCTAGNATSNCKYSLTALVRLAPLVKHHGHTHIRCMIPRPINALRRLLIIAVFRLENVRDEFLRIAVDDGEPGALISAGSHGPPLKEAELSKIEVRPFGL